MANRKRTKYAEGQWFAVPLDRLGINYKGFALGIIVWGSYKTYTALGYFFGPAVEEVPSEAAIDKLLPANAILITWFNNDCLTYGEWPLLQATPNFSRAEWPIPPFGMIDLLDPDLGWLITYDQSLSSEGDEAETRTLCDVSEIVGLPKSGLCNSEALRGLLTSILVRGRTYLATVTEPGTYWTVL